MKQNPTLVQSQRDKKAKKIVQKKLTGVQTRHPWLNTLCLNHSAIATFGAYCTLFINGFLSLKKIIDDSLSSRSSSQT